MSAICNVGQKVDGLRAQTRPWIRHGTRGRAPGVSERVLQPPSGGPAVTEEVTNRVLSSKLRTTQVLLEVVRKYGLQGSRSCSREDAFQYEQLSMEF